MAVIGIAVGLLAAASTFLPLIAVHVGLTDPDAALLLAFATPLLAAAAVAGLGLCLAAVVVAARHRSMVAALLGGIGVVVAIGYGIAFTATGMGSMMAILFLR